jgi:hypothetical protein
VGRAATPQISPLPQAITKFPPQKTNFSINYEISGLKLPPNRWDAEIQRLSAENYELERPRQIGAHKSFFSTFLAALL